MGDQDHVDMSVCQEVGLMDTDDFCYLCPQGAALVGPAPMMTELAMCFIAKPSVLVEVLARGGCNGGVHCLV